MNDRLEVPNAVDKQLDQSRLLEVLQTTYGCNYGWQLARILCQKHFLRLRAFSHEFCRRFFDVVISGLLLLILSPLFLLLIILVRLDGGPAFFTQTRIGHHGKKFRFHKFRSMVVNADEIKAELMVQNESMDGVIFKIFNDPRVTQIGKVLRRTSLDELPQLFNVLRGDMSLVGPRPPLLDEVMLYNAHERQRLETKQGITCIWQVSGRSNIGFKDQVNLDIKYIQNQSVWYDVKLLLKTLPAVVSGRGAA